MKAALGILGLVVIGGVAYMKYKQNTSDSATVSSTTVAQPAGTSPDTNATSPASPAPKGTTASIAQVRGFKSNADAAPNAAMTQPGFLPQKAYLFGKVV
jgi:hypothetical protein